MTRRALQPGATLGVLGGGQLARMWSHAAQSMGYRTAVLDPDVHSPAGLISHVHVPTAYLDPQGLARLASECQAVWKKPILCVAVYLSHRTKCWPMPTICQPSPTISCQAS